MSSTEDWYFGYCCLEDPDEELVEFLEKVEEGKALDIACGLGRNSFYLESLGYEVVGVDMSDIAVNYLNEKAKQGKSRVKGEVCNILDYSFHGEFDIIILSYIFHYFFGKVEQLVVLQRIIEQTKIGGLVYFKVPYSDEYMGSLSLREGMLRNALEESKWDWEILHDEVKYTTKEKGYGTYSFLARKIRCHRP